MVLPIMAWVGAALPCCPACVVQVPWAWRFILGASMAVLGVVAFAAGGHGALGSCGRIGEDFVGLAGPMGPVAAMAATIAADAAMTGAVFSGSRPGRRQPSRDGVQTHRATSRPSRLRVQRTRATTSCCHNAAGRLERLSGMRHFDCRSQTGCARPRLGWAPGPGACRTATASSALIPAGSSCTARRRAASIGRPDPFFVSVSLLAALAATGRRVLPPRTCARISALPPLPLARPPPPPPPPPPPDLRQRLVDRLHLLAGWRVAANHCFGPGLLCRSAAEDRPRVGPHVAGDGQRLHLAPAAHLDRSGDSGILGAGIDSTQHTLDSTVSLPA